uniref:TIR domain-containing protein n=1 Tax=Calidris pygmaea TaxID=425635 RepID=A0A8C3JMN8_9CHAR
RCVQRFLATVATAVGDLPPATATSLNLSHNLLPHLPPGSFSRLPRLLTLDLTHNLLATLAPGAFGGLGALATLNLSHNRLVNLPEGSFLGLGNLRGLLLDHNPLATISPAAFLPLANLTWLTLRGGRLPALGPVAVAAGHLPRLRLLDLCGNRLSALGPGPPLPPSLLALLLCNNSLEGLAGASPGLLPPALRLLDLSYNNISRPSAFAPLRLGNLSRLLVAGNPLDPLGLLEATDLRPRSLDVSGLGLEVARLGQYCRSLGVAPLRRLQLRRNGLRHLPNGSLAACPPATTLDLTGNRLRRVGCLGGLLGVGGGRGELREVVMEHNLLRWPPLCPGWPPLPGVRNLSLRFNRIGGLGPGAFAETPRLRLLRLDLNSLARLDPRGLRGLRWLLELRLDNNLLTDLPPGAFSPLRRLKTLNLRNNRLSVLFPGVLGGLPRLQTLDLGGNNLRHLGGKALGGLGGLRRLYLDRNRLLEVNAETFQPLGVSLEVLDLGGNALRYRSQRLGQRPPFQPLGRLRLLKLQGQRPFGLHIVPQRLFQGLTSLRSLSLAQNGLLAIAADAFDDLGQLEFLTLADSGGGGGDLPAGVFKNLSRLRSLDLENMGLRSLGPQIFGNLSRLERLLLARNQLRGLDKGVATGGLPALRYLDLRKCPLSCACDNAWLPTCPPAYLHSFDTRVCFLDLGLYLFSATSPLVALALALPLLYHRGYWRLRYHLYLLRAWANGRWRPERRRFLYDTFVSYNSADEGWVLGELVPQLEEGGSLRLCLHHRDFRPGRAIVDNIVDAIYNSRKTVCVVSRGYLRSEWCSLEIQLATYRLFEELRDVLVLVFLEPLPEAELSLFHRARRVLLRRTHLRWPQQPQERPLFWAKLIHTLRGGGG